MEDILLDKCKSYIEIVSKLVNENVDEEGLRPPDLFSRLTEAEEEEVVEYLKNQLSTLFHTNYDHILHEILKDSSKHKLFSYFLYVSDRLRFDLSTKDEVGNTLLINFVKAYLPQMNTKGRKLYWSNLIGLIKAGYKIQDNDEEFSKKLFFEVLGDYKKEKRWIKLRVLVITRDLDQYLLVADNDKLCYLVSFQRKENFGLGFKSLSNTLNHAFTFHTDIGDILLKAIRHYDLETKFMEKDENGVFQKLYQEFVKNEPEQDKEFEALVYELYPELKNETKAYL